MLRQTDRVISGFDDVDKRAGCSANVVIDREAGCERYAALFDVISARHVPNRV